MNRRRITTFGGVTGPGSKEDQPISTDITSRKFKPKISAGENYTVPVGASLVLADDPVFENCTVKTAGTYAWPSGVKYAWAIGGSSAEYETLVEYTFVFDGVSSVFGITTMEESLIYVIDQDGAFVTDQDGAYITDI